MHGSTLVNLEEQSSWRFSQPKNPLQELFVREKLGEMNEVLWYERSQSTPPLHGLFYPLLLLLLLC